MNFHDIFKEISERHISVLIKKVGQKILKPQKIMENLRKTENIVAVENKSHVL